MQKLTPQEAIGSYAASVTELAPALARALELVRPAYLTREQLCKELGVDKRTLKSFEAEGLPVHHMGGNTWRFLRNEVDEWISNRPAQKESA